jgi:thiamine phosphate synthase YjbQ (UPF0047 family)
MHKYRFVVTQKVSTSITVIGKDFEEAVEKAKDREGDISVQIPHETYIVSVTDGDDDDSLID